MKKAVHFAKLAGAWSDLDRVFELDAVQELEFEIHLAVALEAEVEQVEEPKVDFVKVEAKEDEFVHYSEEASASSELMELPLGTAELEVGMDLASLDALAAAKESFQSS